MNAFGRSSASYLTVHSRLHRARHICRIPCGSYKYSSFPTCKSLITPRSLFSSLDLPKRSTNHFSSSTATELPHFRDVVNFRQKQAKHSVLIVLSSKEDLPHILDVCEYYGKVKNMIGFVGKSLKYLVIVEFVHDESVEKLLFDSSIKNVTEVFPCHSRCLYFENKGKRGSFGKSSATVIDLSCETKNRGNRKSSSVSEMMVELYEKEKMSELSTRLRFLASVIVQDALKGIYPHCSIFPFGSSVNGFGKDSSDLDLMLRLFPEEVNRNPELFFHTKQVMNGNSREIQRRTIYVLSDILQTFIPGVSNVRRIPNARVPIVKYEHKVLNLDCDISVNNMSAVYMSEILFFCGEYDPRVCPLMYTIKTWAKAANVTCSTPGSWITNFSLTLLMMFFLQTRPIPILPPLLKLIKVPLPDDYKSQAVEYMIQAGSKILKPPTVTEQNSESLGVLLQEFFNFVGAFPFKAQRISLMSGSASSRKDDHAMWIDYPLDESLNVSKNISEDELHNLCQSALVAAKHLKKNSDNDLKNASLMYILGVPEQSDSSRVNVLDFLDEPLQSKKVITGVR